MGTAIEWTDETWNPVVGCSKISPGCAYCYAETMAARLKSIAEARQADGLNPGGALPYVDAINESGRWSGHVVEVPDAVEKPYGWKRPRRVFVCSMSDLFHESARLPFLCRVFEAIGANPRHTFQVLTKRPERMAEFIRGLTWVPANLWCGVSVENRATLSRIDRIRKLPVAVRFLSIEPLLEDLGDIDLDGIDWVILGGESGHGARPLHPAWARRIRDQGTAAGVPFLFKQWGAWANGSRRGRQSEIVLTDGRHGPTPESIDPKIRSWSAGVWEGLQPTVMARVGKGDAGRQLDGREWNQFPEPKGERCPQQINRIQSKTEQPENLKFA